MKIRLPRLALLFSLLVSPVSTFAQWAKTDGPTFHAPVAFLSVAGQGDTLFAGAYSDGGLFRSTDNGVGWSNVLPHTYIYAIVVDNGRVLVGNHEGVFRSSDYGDTWSRDVSGLTPGFGVYSLTANGSLLFAGTDLGVFRSTDGGNYWTNVSPQLPSASQTIFSVLLKDNLLFVGTYQGIFRSSDLGGTWQSMNQGLPTYPSGLPARVNTLLQDDQILFVGTGGFGIYKSSDNGESWQPASLGLPHNSENTYFQSIYSLSKKGTKLYTSPDEEGGIYVSTNEGESWSKVSSQITGKFVFDFAVSNDNLIAATFEGIWRSMGPDSLWTPILRAYSKAASISAMTAGQSVLLASGASNYWNGWLLNTYYSVNKGQTWTAIDSTSPVKYFQSFGKGDGFLLGGGTTVFRSTDEGIHWTASDSGIRGFRVNSFLIVGERVFAGGGGWDLRLCPNCGGEFGGVFNSTDNGFTWSRLGLVDTAVFALASIGPNLFAGTLRGVYLSTDAGMSWKSRSNGLPLNTMVTTFGVIGGDLFAGTSRGIYLSSDYGTTWSPVNAGLPVDSTHFLVPNLLAYGNHMIAGTSEGIYLSSYPWTNWVAANAGFNAAALNVHSVVVHGDEFFAGTNDGVWQRPIAQIISSVDSIQQLPVTFRIYQNYPNPFNPSTTISYDLPRRSYVTLKIFNVLGQEVATLVNEIQEEGFKSVKFDAGGLSSGVYFYQLQADNFVENKKMILLR
jgi:photosystem II stability/assembly factor-like uncharacterized protein